MRRPLSRWSSVTASVVLLAALAGCGGDDTDATDDPTISTSSSPSGSTSPSPTTSSSPSESSAPTTGAAGDADAFCGAVTAQELQQAVGQPFSDPQAASDDPDVLNCKTATEDSTVLVTWSLQPTTASLDEAVDALTLPGLDRSAVTVAGQPGALLTGEQPVGTAARVVVLLDGQVLFASVDTNTGLGEVDLTPQAQRDLVTEVADRAAATLGG